jgi:hypothetical protein
VTHLSVTDADKQFNWDTDLAVDFDVVDFGFLRGNIFANVETMVGSERRGVDPNQSGYPLDVTVFFRLPRGELASTFHHVSRHLSASRRSTRSGVKVGTKSDQMVEENQTTWPLGRVSENGCAARLERRQGTPVGGL